MAKKKLLLTTVILVISLAFVAQSLRSVKMTPMTNEYFDKIYKINNQGRVSFLHVSCK